MKTHIVRTPADRSTTDLLEPNGHRPRHTLFVDLQGWEAMLRPDVSNIDQLSLLQATFSGLAQEYLPASPSLGADWTRFMPSDRREGRCGALESAALFCVMMATAERPPPPDLRLAP